MPMNDYLEKIKDLQEQQTPGAKESLVERCRRNKGNKQENQRVTEEIRRA